MCVGSPAPTLTSTLGGPASADTSSIRLGLSSREARSSTRRRASLSCSSSCASCTRAAPADVAPTNPFVTWTRSLDWPPAASRRSIARRMSAGAILPRRINRSSWRCASRVRPARRSASSQISLARTARHGAWHCLAAGTHRFECMLGKVQVARGREHAKVAGDGNDTRQGVRGVGYNVHERTGLQAGLEHVAAGQQHPDGRCTNRRGNDEVAVEWSDLLGSPADTAAPHRSALAGESTRREDSTAPTSGASAIATWPRSTARQMDSASVSRPASERASACQIRASRASPSSSSDSANRTASDRTLSAALARPRSSNRRASAMRTRAAALHASRRLRVPATSRSRRSAAA